MRIAVFVNSQLKASTIDEAVNVHIYEKKGDTWYIKNTIPITFASSNSLGAIRDFLEILIEKLHNCKIVVAQKILGVAYNVLDRAGFHLWEFDGYPESFLSFIEKEEIIKRYELKKDSDPFEFFLKKPVKASMKLTSRYYCMKTMI